MTKEWGVDRKEGTFHYDMDIESFTKDGSLTDAVIKTTLDMGRKIGMIKGEVPLSKVVDLSILREVQKELGIVS